MTVRLKFLCFHFQLTNERNAFRVAYAQHWQRSGVDVVLCPAGPHTAPKLEETLSWSYTNVWCVPLSSLPSLLQAQLG